MMFKQRIHSPSVEIVSSPPGSLSSRSRDVPQSTACASTSKKRKSTNGDIAESSSSKRSKTVSARRWKWIILCKPERTSIWPVALFRPATDDGQDPRDASGQASCNECDGDESGHPYYGYPELCKPKVKARKEDDRWSCVNRCRPEIRMKRAAIEAYIAAGVISVLRERLSRTVWTRWKVHG
ncbi:hypothetical protein CPB85DRAFT_1436566 [Mucidula mucida]|nr:hypothetical protein CPB85DRAFT_1436566 [Mucidula mucida]